MRKSRLLPLLLIALGISVPMIHPVKAVGVLYVSPGNTPGSLASGSTFTVSIKVASIDPFNGWDVAIVSDPSVIRPTALTIGGNLLEANFSIPVSSLSVLSACVNGGTKNAAANNTGCVGGVDGLGVAHSAVACSCLPPMTTPSNGLLFTVTYTVVARPPANSLIHIFADQGVGVGIEDGSATPVPHNDVDGSYGSPAYFTVSASPSSLNVILGTSQTSTVTVASVNSFTGNIVVNSSIVPALSNSPTVVFNGLSSTSVTLGSSATVTMTVSTTMTTSTRSYTVFVETTGTLSTGLLVHQFFDVIVTVPQPDFKMTASPISLIVPRSSTNTSTISITSLAGFSGTVTLQTQPVTFSNGTSASGFLTASVTPTSATLTSGSSGTSTLKVSTTASTPIDNYTVTVVGTSGSLRHQVLIPVRVPAPDFKMVPNPTSLTFTGGTSGTSNSNITLTSINGFNGNVTLSLAPAIPSLSALLNVTFVLLPPGGTGGARLTVSTTASTPPSKYGITITGTNRTGGITHTATLTIIVNDFRLAANMTSLTIAQGSSHSVTLTVTSIAGFSGTVSLVTNSTVALRPTATLNVTSVTLSAGGSAHAGLTVSTILTTTTGSYTIFVDGSSGGLTHQVLIAVSVIPPNARIDMSATAASPSSITAGLFSISNITLTSAKGFAGTVTLATSPTSVNGLKPTLNVTSVTLTSGGSGGAKLNVTTTASTPAGTYTVTVSATSGSVTNSTTVTVTVLADFTISPSSASASFVASSSGNSNFTLVSLGFTGSVTLKAVVSPSPTNHPSTQLNVTSVPLSPGQQGGVELTFSTSASTPANTYSIKVNATAIISSTQVSKFPVVSLVVTANFTISASPATPPSFDAGGSTTSTITLTSKGLSGLITLAAPVTPPATGVKTSFTMNVTLSPGQTGTTTLTLTTNASTPANTYTISVAGTSGTITNSTNLRVVVTGNFTFTASAPSPGTVIQGSYATSTVTLNSLGLTGPAFFALAVTPSANAPALSLTPTSVPLSAGRTGSTKLFINTTSTVPQGTYTITLNATTQLSTGPLTHTRTVTVNVSAAPTITRVSVSPTTVTIGQKVTVTVSMTNSGTVNENFIILVKWGDTTATSQNETLAAGGSADFTLTWDTTQSMANTKMISAAAFQDGIWSTSLQGQSVTLAPTAQPFFSSSQIALVGGGVAAAVVLLLGIILLLRRRKTPVA